MTDEIPTEPVVLQNEAEAQDVVSKELVPIDPATGLHPAVKTDELIGQRSSDYYLAETRRKVGKTVWRAVLRTCINQAIEGDSKARDCLIKLLIGDPTQVVLSKRQQMSQPGLGLQLETVELVREVVKMGRRPGRAKGKPAPAPDSTSASTYDSEELKPPTVQ